MSLCFDPSSLSKTSDFVVFTPAQAREARPLAIIIDLIDEHAISPDFDCRAISPISECSQSSDDTSRSRLPYPCFTSSLTPALNRAPEPESCPIAALNRARTDPFYFFESVSRRP
ncbi:hypothetical protein C8R44DRAFT_867791 [Mycena epipterygia]|nr:hypothetical protein C8R44DRAFT_867791 [Mycena epipterygia]